MTLIDLRHVKEEEPMKDRAPAAIETYRAAPDELIGPRLVSRKRHLDVDAVLARSLRRVTAEEL